MGGHYAGHCHTSSSGFCFNARSVLVNLVLSIKFFCLSDFHTYVNSYQGFPELDAGMFPSSVPQAAMSAPRPSVALVSGLAGQLCPYSPMTRRTKQEVKAMQKLTAKQADDPSLWAR